MLVKLYAKTKVELWYRGHRTNTWELKSNLYRDAKRIKGADNEITVLRYDFSHRICRQSGKFTFHQAVGPLSYSWSDMVIGNEKFVDAIIVIVN